ncbi:acyl-CoA dehydrogenase [Mycolicibacterium duvalii]|uniref:Acyl-CoA dehydrogenase n=1 Tax=Mycolicibacterium duvalii TaxID=39688 RepID=A0A7I7K3K9_9MYCO|nr:acyl-CoA dehydrogenase family protein [Mycolicibacterium duvalii]MCV7370578.1 acyl-CoA dehydrogenase family protein [Mycolicibacterium duvalii]PEG39870.1 acyl-CoA dehydrogenase [Mycolicibacterium duvalii]BBX18041.1 acyl-CoA dehydrogenase [Mycolicibacterium duvalii]
MTREPSLTDIADATAQLDELAATVRRIVNQAWSVGHTRALLDSPAPAFDENLWATLVGMGWPDVLVAESAGGGGGSIRELCVLTEATGTVAAPVPLAAAAAAHWCEQRGGDDIAVLLDDIGATMSEGRVDGHWPLVPYGAVTDRLVILADRHGEPVLGTVDATGGGVKRQTERPLDHSPAANITLDGAPLCDIATGADAVARHRDAVARARLATVAELIGTASAAHEAAVAYAKMRVTFGRPIGARQAIKHRLVEQRSVIEVARALVHRAADALELRHPDAESLVSLAVFWAIDTLRGVPEGATQVFGGIAYTWEHDAHVHLRRAATLVTILGTRAQHRSVVADWLQSR